MPIAVPMAVTALIEALRSDREYYQVWRSNLSTQFYDAYFNRSAFSQAAEHSSNWMLETCDIAAEKFLHLLMDEH